MAKRKQSSRDEDTWKKIFKGLHGVIESQDERAKNLVKIYKSHHEHWVSSMKLLQDQISELESKLSKSISTVKPINPMPDSPATEISPQKQSSQSPEKLSFSPATEISPQKRSRQSRNKRRKANHSRQSPQKLSFSGVRKPPKKSKFMIGKHKYSSSSWKQGGPSSTAGYHQRGKQPVTELQGSKLLYHHDPRAHHQSHHVQVSNVTQHRPLAIGTPFRRHDQQEYAHYTSFRRHDQERAHYTSFPRYDQERAHYTSFTHHDREHAQYTSGSLKIAEPDPRYFQIRDQTAYYGSSSVYRRMP